MTQVVDLTITPIDGQGRFRQNLKIHVDKPGACTVALIDFLRNNTGVSAAITLLDADGGEVRIVLSPKGMLIESAPKHSV